MKLFTQLRQDVPDSPIGLQLLERKEGWLPQTPIQMDHVNSFRKGYDSQSDYPYQIVFSFDSSWVSWEYQSESHRDLDHTYLLENYVKMS